MTEEFKKCGLTCSLFRNEEFFDPVIAEERISNSVATVAILTAGSLETREMLFALQAASFHYKELSRIILVKDINIQY